MSQVEDILTRFANIPSALKKDEELQAAKSDSQMLLTGDKRKIAKFSRSRWDRLNKSMRDIQVELKINMLRYKGNPFAQRHPDQPNRVWLPKVRTKRMPPSQNKIRRTVHRYVAMVTADEPVLQGIPSRGTDEARDHAEASTHILRGEWDRMNLHVNLQRAQQLAAVMRSAFWFFEWDPDVGPRKTARKYRTTEDGEKELAPVDSSGEFVDDEKAAAQIREGNLTMEVLSPLNVRWAGGRYAHEADELMVGKMVTLRKLYAAYPKAKKLDVKKLLTNRPPAAEKWLTDFRGERIESRLKQDDMDDWDGMIGENVSSDHHILDEPAFVLHYFRNVSAQYPDGAHVVTAGEHTLYRGKLQWGVLPIAHFKCIDEIDDILGVALVDILRDPQELLDFVNGQILRYLQMLKRRWFVPIGSVVNSRDLLNPTMSVIEYNPDLGEPTPEVQPEIPNSLVDWADRGHQEFNDASGIHDIAQGKHVPGVQSGRHAEALRSGDETLLGLTRTQAINGLEAAGRVILAAVRAEWTTKRQVRYLGDGRKYLQKEFSADSVGDTGDVQLAPGTLLMLTPAQKLETLLFYFQSGILAPDEMRRMAPLGDTAGISITEDPHYMRARRQNMVFLDGPPSSLVAELKQIDEAGDRLEAQAVALENQMKESTTEEEASTLQPIAEQLAVEAEEVSMRRDLAIAEHVPRHYKYEEDPAIAKVHAMEHFRALADERAESMRDKYPWWVTAFEEHALREWQIAAQPVGGVENEQLQQNGGGQPQAGLDMGGMMGGGGAPPI